MLLPSEAQGTPQTTTTAGGFQGVSVSVFLLYNNGDVEKELFERLLGGCCGRIVKALYYSCKSVTLNLGSSTAVNGCLCV